jgi:hypothetical protein
MSDGHPLLGSAYRYNEEAERFVNAKHERIATIIHEYDPRLALAWIPPENRDPIDVYPYVVIYSHDDGTDQAVFYLTEAELDERVLARLFMNDFNKHDPDILWKEMQAKQMAEQLMHEKEIEDEAAEKWEFGEWALKTRLNKFTHNGKTYRE